MFGYNSFFSKNAKHNNLKKNIIKRLKTFSQLKTEYNIDDIYRSGKRKYFSEIAKKYQLEGCPLSRPTCMLSEDYYINTEKDETILEPIWYSSDLEVSKSYCNRKKDCTTYVYTPRDSSLIKDKPLLFLDLTGLPSGSYTNPNGKTEPKYELYQPLMQQIYEYIFMKYNEHVFVDEDKSRNLCVDNPCNNVFTIEEILSAYGYFGGFRNSEHFIDKFFTLELFQIIKDLSIEAENNCAVIGYYHATVITGTINENNEPEIDYDSHFPAEFAIKYRYSIDKNSIIFKGEIPTESLSTIRVSKNRTRSRANSRTNSRTNSKSNKTRKQKTKK